MSKQSAQRRYEPEDFDYGTVDGVIEWYLQSGAMEDFSSMWREDCARVLNRFAEAFKGWPVTRIKAFHLLQFVKDQKQLRSRWSHRRWVTQVKTPFHRAYLLGLIERNPFVGVHLPKGNFGKDISAEQYDAIYNAARPWICAAMLFLSQTGARPGELAALRVRHVDLEQSICTLPPESHKSGRKTGRPRILYLNVVAKGIVQTLMEKRTNPDDFVFLNAYRHPVVNRDLAKEMKKIVRKLGLPDWIKPYCLRHLFATRAIMNNVPTTTVAELLGHADLQSICHYTHIQGKRDYLFSALAQATGCPAPVPQPAAASKPAAAEPSRRIDS
ncbi:MAG TPA: site-specific integrase, partial [Gemmataceae bacterium]|nr:site-specific integrase [Gemmataceae bacterium]